MPGADALILTQPARCGLQPDEPPVLQSQRGALYRQALDRLVADGHAYACGCSRRDIGQALLRAGRVLERHAERVYPGTCRGGLQGKAARAMRVRTLDATGRDIVIDWQDRRVGAQTQNVTQAVGDFVVHRADGSWAYQLAVVVDDAAQGITHVVRGEDLTDNTARQIHLQRLLGLPTLQYLHTPLVLGANGEKLSKQNGAAALQLADPLQAIRQAGEVLDLRCSGSDTDTWLAQAVTQWRTRWQPPSP